MSAVVIGIIDDAIAFANARFRKTLAKSRVEYWWLQDGLPAKKRNSTLTDGYELTKSEIDDLLKLCKHGGAVDEDEVYRHAGLIDFQREGHNSAAWRIAHGTHVLDLAAGYDIAKAPGDRPLVLVQLPARVTADTSGGDLGYYAAYAIRYILDRAKQIGAALGTPNLPVVINFSYGKIAGPHDGTSEIEVLIEDYIARAAARGVTLRVVLPAGNSYLSRCHAELAFNAPNRVHDLQWRVQPDDQTPSYLEIYMPPRPSSASRARVELTVTSPTGVRHTIPDIHGKRARWKSGKDFYAQMNYVDATAPSTRGMFLVALRPTRDLDTGNVTAPSGLWTVSLKNKSLAASARVHAWIQRDDSLYGHPIRGRQSYFDEATYQRYDHAGRVLETDDPKCPVKRAGTLNAIATGKSPVVLGGYVRSDMAPAPYTAAGPTALANRAGPDAMSASERSRATQGLLAAGSRSGSTVAMGGSSVAAPQVTRLIAEALANNKPSTRTAIADRATADENNKPPGRPRPSNTRGGGGRLRLPITGRTI